MSMVSSQLVEDAVLRGFQESISTTIGMIPVAGPFVQLIFGHLWDLALAERTAAAQKQEAMNSLFESVGKMINKALAENVADQARAYNASISQLGQDYRVSVQSFDKGNALAVQKVVVRFESCKSTLVHMLNLYSQSSYMKHTVLSYGSALALYVTLLREMMLAGADCGYSKAEITDFHNDINERLASAYEKTMFEAVSKLVKESGEFAYPNMGNAIMDLGKLVGGLMNFNTDWHDGKPCLIAKSHPDYYNCDLVDNKAYYQLQFRPKTGSKNYYSMPQVFMNNRAALHIYTDVDKDVQLASFTVENTMHVNLRAYYLVDYDDFPSGEVEVTISTRSNPKVHQFYLNKRSKAIVSFPWVRLYYSLSSEGGAWSTDYDRFSANLLMHYDEYQGFEPQKNEVYTIKTKAGGSTTKNYYIIGFEVVPTSGVPNVLESLFNVVEETASAAISGVSNVVSASTQALGNIGKALF